MEIRLDSLKIRNFMGCRELDISFDGKDMRIYGDNATGKTTLQHSFNWLLFDKNAYGKTDFGIKPFDASGEVIHRLETSVEALFHVDGLPICFKKCLKEKWTRKRGSAEDTYSGNETEYYINTVPKKKKEYTEKIAELINENVFRMITNPLYFNENIDWKDRRKMLLDICGDIRDEDVIATDPELEPLLAELKSYSIDELKSITASGMKTTNKELGLIPSRIAEADLAKPTPRDDVDVSALEGLEEKRKELVQKKSDIINGAEILRLKAEMDSKRRDSEKVRAGTWNKYELEEYKELQEIAVRSGKLEGELKMLMDTTIRQIDIQLESNNAKKAHLSEAWDEVFKQAFLGTTCPTCKQELPPEQIEENKKKFNSKKASRLDAIESELGEIKKFDNSLIYKKAEAVKKIEGIQTELEELEKRKAELTDILDAKEKDFLSEKNLLMSKLADDINDLRNAIIEQELNSGDIANGVDSEIQDIERQIAPIKDYIAEQSMIKRQDARIEELKEQQKELSRQYSIMERKLYLVEKFTKCKVAMIDAKVNSLFQYARFRLFDVQVNGGIAETCEATYNGVPYRDLNTAGRINIGLDIINTLSTIRGITAPIFIDNMESVTRPIDTKAQRVELVVSEKDKELRLEKK